MNHPTLTVTFSSPMEDIIRVTVEHFRGTKNREPDLQLNEEKVLPEITEDGTGWTFRTGRTCARISKAARGWRVAYFYEDVLLTSSEYHGMAHAHHKESGKDYMMDSLMLAPGECVYGLGDRFIPPAEIMAYWWSPVRMCGLRWPVRRWNGYSSALADSG